MFDSTCIGNGFVTAVVVGEDQSLRADDLTSTASTKNYDRIFQRRFVETVQLFFRKFQPVFHHVVIDLLAEQVNEPHALVGDGQLAKPDTEQQEKKKNAFLHKG